MICKSPELVVATVLTEDCWISWFCVLTVSPVPLRDTAEGVSWTLLCSLSEKQLWKATCGFIPLGRRVFLTSVGLQPPGIMGKGAPFFPLSHTCSGWLMQVGIHLQNWDTMLTQLNRKHNQQSQEAVCNFNCIRNKQANKIKTSNQRHERRNVWLHT